MPLEFADSAPENPQPVVGPGPAAASGTPSGPSGDPFAGGLPSTESFPVPTPTPPPPPSPLVPAPPPGTPAPEDPFDIRAPRLGDYPRPSVTRQLPSEPAFLAAGPGPSPSPVPAGNSPQPGTTPPGTTPAVSGGTSRTLPPNAKEVGGSVYTGDTNPGSLNYWARDAYGPGNVFYRNDWVPAPELGPGWWKISGSTEPGTGPVDSAPAYSIQPVAPGAGAPPGSNRPPVPAPATPAPTTPLNPPVYGPALALAGHTPGGRTTQFALGGSAGQSLGIGAPRPGMTDRLGSLYGRPPSPGFTETRPTWYSTMPIADSTFRRSPSLGAAASIYGTGARRYYSAARPWLSST